MPIAPMTPDTMAALSVEAAEAAIVWLHVHRAEVWLATEIAAGLVLAYLAIWALLRGGQVTNRGTVVPWRRIAAADTDGGEA